MYRLYKITLKSDGTEQTSRDEYEDVTLAEGNFEFQKGLAMENNTLTFLMLLDNIGQIHNNYIAKVGEGELKPRLYEVKTTASGDAPKTYAHDTANEVSADYYKRLGGAKQNADVKAIMLRGIGANGEQLEYAYWVRPIEPVEPTPEPEQEQPQGE